MLSSVLNCKLFKWSYVKILKRTQGKGYKLKEESSSLINKPIFINISYEYFNL